MDAEGFIPSQSFMDNWSHCFDNLVHLEKETFEVLLNLRNPELVRRSKNNKSDALLPYLNSYMHLKEGDD